MIPKASKWTGFIAIPIASLIVLAQWMAYIIVVQPEVVDASQFTGGPWLEAAGLGLVGGLFVLSFVLYGQTRPMVSVGDPLLPRAYEHH